MTRLIRFTFAFAAAFGLVVVLVASSALSSGVEVQASGLGNWSAVQTWPVEATNSALLPSGKLLYYPAWMGDSPYLWDPTTGLSTAAAQAGYNIFCTGMTLLADGRLFLAGGNLDSGQTTGLPNASIYDPSTNTWTGLPNMLGGRWYPTTTTLANGDVLVVSGSHDDFGDVVEIPQVWQTASATWRNLDAAPLAMGLYPEMYLAPNGRVFEAGWEETTRYLNTSGAGAWTDVADNNFGGRDYGPSVMYTPGKILLIGGGDPPTSSAEVIDLNNPSPGWRFVASMANARRQASATILPDGTVLVMGGSSGPGWDNASYPVYATELWNPTTETWTTLSSNSVYRGYHSTATLLPDARVVLAGGEIGGPTAEIFSPPYLSRGVRPSVSSAPASVTYGQNFTVTTPAPPSISKVSLIRLGSVTHTFNMNQRFQQLTFSRFSGGLRVKAPADSVVAPPGDYMLFILDGSGVPSVARIIRIG